ncbi:MAG: peptide ABC transporter substrate-binding protein [Patescibacteria group bacterium]
MNLIAQLKKYISRFQTFRKTNELGRFHIRKIFYLPKISTKQEMRVLFLLIVITLVSGLTLASRLYLQMTISVPRIGSSYTEGLLEDPRAINPLYASHDTDRDISHLIFSGLFIYNGSGIIGHDLASDLDISTDGKVYTVTLKKNLQWHDGQPLTADDVVFTIHTIQNGQFRSPLRSDWQGVSVEKLSDDSVRFSLRAPYAPFIENLTLGIIPQHIWQHVTPEQAPLHEANLKPVGSGPYRFDQMRQSKDGSIQWYQIMRNANYHRPGPYIQKIIFQFFKNEDELFAAWHRGIIDGFGNVSPRRIAEINPEKSLLFSLHMPRVFGIFFNPKRASELENAVIRQAIAYAIDRNEISQGQQQNKAIPAQGPLPWLGIGTTSLVYAHDLEHARTLLEQAGWKDLDGDGIREKIQKKKTAKQPAITTTLRFTLTTSDSPDLVQTAAILQRQLKNAGIDLVIEKKTYQDLESNTIRPRNFEMLLFGQVYGYEPDPFAFWHSSQVKDPGLNITFFSDKKADKLLEDIRKTDDPNTRNAAYRNFSDIIVKNLPALFLFSQDYLYVLPTDIMGVSPIKIAFPADRFNEINEWYRSTTRKFIWGK